MKSVVLRRGNLHTFEDANDPKALTYIENWKLCNEALNAGTLYCRWIDGDRKGSIAKLKRDEAYIQDENPPVIRARTYRNLFTGAVEYQLDGGSFYVIATWKGRNNKVKVSIPYHPVELLIGDDIQTVYQMFDKNAAKEEVLKNPDQKDIDGNVLNIGDRVFYINARYGSGFCLQRGIVQEFKVAIDSSGHKISTVIKHEDSTEISTLKYPEEMVCKI